AEKGNDAVRIDLAVRALDADLIVLAPLGQWGVPRADKVAYAKARGIPVPLTADSPYSTDVNLWGRSIECGVLDDPWREPPDEIYELTKQPADEPEHPDTRQVRHQAH